MPPRPAASCPTARPPPSPAGSRRAGPAKSRRPPPGAPTPPCHRLFLGRRWAGAARLGSALTTAPAAASRRVSGGPDLRAPPPDQPPRYLSPGMFTREARVPPRGDRAARRPPPPPPPPHCPRPRLGGPPRAGTVQAATCLITDYLASNLRTRYLVLAAPGPRGGRPRFPLGPSVGRSAASAGAGSGRPPSDSDLPTPPPPPPPAASRLLMKRQLRQPAPSGGGGGRAERAERAVKAGGRAARPAQPRVSERQPTAAAQMTGICGNWTVTARAEPSALGGAEGGV